MRRSGVGGGAAEDVRTPSGIPAVRQPRTGVPTARAGPRPMAPGSPRTELPGLRGLFVAGWHARPDHRAACVHRFDEQGLRAADSCQAPEPQGLRTARPRKSPGNPGSSVSDPRACLAATRALDRRDPQGARNHRPAGTVHVGPAQGEGAGVDWAPVGPWACGSRGPACGPGPGPGPLRGGAPWFTAR